MSNVLLYLGCILVTGWGIAHLFPTAAVVKGFGNITKDNKQLIRMEWIAEGIALIFIGLVVFLAAIVGEPGNTVSKIIIYAAAAASLAIALLALFTGARTSIVPVKICPVVMAVVTVLFLAGNMI